MTEPTAPAPADKGQQFLKDAAALLRKLDAERAQYQKDAERFASRLFELGEMESAPCFYCGYNGVGYFQPATHPCATRHHAAIAKEGK